MAEPTRGLNLNRGRWLVWDDPDYAYHQRPDSGEWPIDRRTVIGSFDTERAARNFSRTRPGSVVAENAIWRQHHGGGLDPENPLAHGYSRWGRRYDRVPDTLADDDLRELVRIFAAQTYRTIWRGEITVVHEEGGAVRVACWLRQGKGTAP